MKQRFWGVVCLVFGLGLNTAFAVELSNDGMGEVLIYPVISSTPVESGDPLQSLVTLRNRSPNPIATRLVFRRGGDGEVVRQFNAFFGPHDVWAVSLINGSALGLGDQELMMVGSDATCFDADTEQVAGSNFRVNIGQMTNGWLEVYALGALSTDDAEVLTIEGLSSNASLDNCPDSYPMSGVALQPVSNPLSGSLQAVDVAAGLGFSIDTVALRDFGLSTVAGDLSSRQSPTLAQAQPAIAIIDGESVEFLNGLDAVSASLTVRSLQTPYSVEEVLSARTALALLFPTRHLYPDGEGPFRSNVQDIDPEQAMDQPGVAFTGYLGDRNGALHHQNPGVICDPQPPYFGPLGPVVSASQQLLRFGETTGINYESVAWASYYSTRCVPSRIDGEPEFDSGVYQLIAEDFQLVAADGSVIRGLPLVANSISVVLNANLGNGQVGLLATYSWQNQMSIERGRMEAPLMPAN